MSNIILLSDSYKVSHSVQYPPGTEKVFSYLEARKPAFNVDKVVFFGLQYFLQKYLSTPITLQNIEEARDILSLHMGIFDSKKWEYILKVHGGRLPVSIRAVPEGFSVPVSNVLMTVENTDPNCFWLTNYLETLLVQVWYPTTVATISRRAREIISHWATADGEDKSSIQFKLHDFGFRGVSSVESAGIGGLAHLVSFKGSDTVEALRIGKQYYFEPCAGFSIPASEHSTMTSWGKKNETLAYKNMLEQFPAGLVAVVSDSYDIVNACENIWGGTLKDRVLKRNGTLVIRPDSGDPITLIPKLLDILGQKFGHTTDHGKKVLNDKVRLIQGDGVNLHSIDAILNALSVHGWSTKNLSFGMGGALLQKCDRDTFSFAFKCSSATINGQQRDVFKEPVTSTAKHSKKGTLILTRDAANNFVTSNGDVTTPGNYLREVYRDGKILVTDSLQTIRNRDVL